MFLVRKHRVVLVRKHKGLFGVSLCSSGQEIQYWVSRLISKLSTPRKPIIFHSVYSCTYIHTCIHTYIHTYIHIYIHNHSPTYMYVLFHNYDTLTVASMLPVARSHDCCKASCPMHPAVRHHGRIQREGHKGTSFNSHTFPRSTSSMALSLYTQAQCHS